MGRVGVDAASCRAGCWVVSICWNGLVKLRSVAATAAMVAEKEVIPVMGMAHMAGQTPLGQKHLGRKLIYVGCHMGVRAPVKLLAFAL